MNYIALSACPDCGGSMAEVDLVDTSTGEEVRRFSYAVAPGTEAAMLGRFTPRGELKFFLCIGCGRILLYAQPR